MPNPQREEFIEEKVKEFDSAFNWTDQVKDTELELWRVMYGFTPDDVKKYYIESLEQAYTHGKEEAVRGIYKAFLEHYKGSTVPLVIIMDFAKSNNIKI